LQVLGSGAVDAQPRSGDRELVKRRSQQMETARIGGRWRSWLSIDISAICDLLSRSF